MVHYAMEEWADCVRGVLRGEAYVAMQLHLDGGCETCNVSVRYLRHLADVTACDRFYGLSSAPLVPAAIGAFAASTAPAEPPVVQKRRAVMAVPVCDSASRLQPSGAPALRSATRHLTYEAGSYLVNLRLEEPIGGLPAYLIGQSVSRAAPETALSGLPVSLLSGTRLVAVTQSDELGEFSIDYEARSDSWLRISMEAEQIEIRLAPFGEIG